MLMSINFILSVKLFKCCSNSVDVLCPSWISQGTSLEMNIKYMPWRMVNKSWNQKGNNRNLFRINCHNNTGNQLLFSSYIYLKAVIAKYAGHARHVRQTSADVRQRAQALPDILSSRVQYTENVKQGKQEWPLIFASHQLGKMSDKSSKCPAEHWRPVRHFVRQARNNFGDHCERPEQNNIIFHQSSYGTGLTVNHICVWPDTDAELT